MHFLLSDFSILDGDVIFLALVAAITLLGKHVVWTLWIVGLIFILASAYLLQRRLITTVKRSAEEHSTPRSMLYLELTGILGALFPPFMIAQWTRNARRAKPKAEALSNQATVNGGTESSLGDDLAANERLEKDAKPTRAWLVPSIGPSYLIASYVVIGLFVLGEWMKLPVAKALNFASDDYAWNEVLFGTSQHTGLLISMHGLEAFAFAFTAFVWTSVWLLVAMSVRLILSNPLRRQGATEEEIRTTPLIWWRQWYGMRDLVAADATFKRWAWGAFAVLAVTGAAGFFLYAVGRVPLEPQTVVVGALVILGWFLHLTLVGAQADVVAEEVEEAAAAVVAAVPGWDAVEMKLQELHGLKPLAPTRQTKVGRRSVAAQAGEYGMSPLLLQEIPAFSKKQIKPTQMQVAVMQRLFASRYVPGAGVSKEGESDIGRSAFQSDAVERTQLYVASAEGSGKTTLAMLTAMNHVLVHAQSVLIIAASARDAADLATKLREQIEPSTLRWSIQVRLADDDLIQEAIDGTVPDIIVCDQEWLTLVYLRNEPQMSRFTESLGFIIVDDADAYQGPQAVHAQLSFTRLNLCLSRSLAGQSTARLGGNSTSMLVLSSISEEGFLASAKTLVKRELVHLSFEEPEPRDEDVLGEHQVLDLNDFVDSRGEQLLFADVVAACEHAQVPWTYWRAGARKEDRPRLRDRLLLLPRFQRENPLEAAVVFVEGRYTHVEREFARLRFAGIDFLEQPVQGSKVVTFIRIVDRDEQMAFDVRDGGGTLSKLIQRLPMPLVHVPARTAAESHLTAELIHRELELEEVLECFGEHSLRRIRELAERGRITVESRTLLEVGGQAFQEAVYVKARARAVYNSQDPDLKRIDGVRLLEPPPTQVRHTIDKPVRLFDRVSLNTLDEVDPLVASFLYFPFSVYKQAGSQWLVMDRVGEAGMQTYRDEVRRGDVVLEPYSENWLAVPERRLRFIPVDPLEAEPIQYGELPVRVAQLRVFVHGDHLSTRYVDPDLFVVKQRRRISVEESKGAYKSEHGTDGLVIHVASLWRNVDASLHEPLRALFISALRMSVGLAYATDENSIDVALMSKGNENEVEWLTFFELSVGGNGTIRALARDGLENLLRLTRLIIERVLNHDRLLSRYNDRPMTGVTEESAAKEVEDDAISQSPDDPEELTVPMYKSAAPDEKREQEKRLRQIILEWIDARLMPETGSDVFEKGRSYPSGYEMGEKATSDLGRAWVAESMGVSDLRWTRLHWFSPRGDERREADVGISRELIVEMTNRRNQLTEEVLESKLQAVAAHHVAHQQATSSRSRRRGEDIAALTDVDDIQGSTQASSATEEAFVLRDESSRTAKEMGQRRGIWARLRGFIVRIASKFRRGSDAADDSMPTSKDLRSSSEWPSGYNYPPGKVAHVHGFPLDRSASTALSRDAIRRLVAFQLSAGRLLDDAAPLVESLAELIDKNLQQIAENDPFDLGAVDAEDMVLADTLMLASALVSERGNMSIPALPAPWATVELDNPMLGVHKGETNTLTAALIVALFHAYWERPAGIFINAETDEVLAGLHLRGTGEHTPEDAFELLGDWRETMLLESGASTHTRGRIKKGRAVTHLLPNGEGVMVGVDLMASRRLTALSETQHGPWVFIPLCSSEVPS